MKKTTLLLTAVLTTFMFLVATLVAQVPQQINYQGVLTAPTSGNPVPDGSYSIAFAIYSAASGGTALWTETQNVTTTNGRFDVLLGSTIPVAYSVFSGGDRYLGVKVGADAEMTPRKRLVSVGYALKSHDADKVDGQDASAFAPSIHDHDGRYFTESELNTSDGNPPNTGSNRVSWNNLRDVPSGFADGTDDVGTGGGGISQINVGSGMSVTSPSGPTTTLGLTMGHGNNINADMVDGKHASNFANTSHSHSGGDITSGKISNSRLNTGSGNGLDADMVDGKHASNFATTSHNHLGEHWTGSYAWADASLKVENLSSGPGVYGINRGGGNGVRGQTNGTGIGVYGQCDNSGPGVVGRSSTGDGVQGFGSASGVYGEGAGSGGQGVLGKGIGANAEGVVGVGGSNGIGVNGMSTNQPGVLGTSTKNDGVRGVSTNFSGVRGNSTNGHGVEGQTNASSGAGVYGQSSNGRGVVGQSNSKNGVEGTTSAGGSSTAGVKGSSSASSGTGIIGEANSGSSAYGVWGKSTSGYAGYFTGNVHVTNNFSVSGSKAFKIDHPLDPANKYLYHFCMESNDRANVYSGNVTLDASGEATVELAEWFEALNKDFRYQLTCIGGFARVYIAEGIKRNRFKIAGGVPGMKISWQVIGTRNDVYAKAHQTQVEVVKSGLERGTYLAPKEFGMPESAGVNYAKSQATTVEMQ